MLPVFYVVYFIWFLSEILLNRFLHSKASDKQEADKNSLRIIWITIIVAMFAATFISMKYYFPISGYALIQEIGLIVIIAGIVLRLLAVYTLGKFFTVDVTIREGHQLLKTGFYKTLRHPSYFASLISFIGYGISLNNWLSLIIIVVAILSAFIYRIKIEEKTLIAFFGNEYLDYKKKTSAIIPFIY